MVEGVGWSGKVKSKSSLKETIWNNRHCEEGGQSNWIMLKLNLKKVYIGGKCLEGCRDVGALSKVMPPIM